MNATSLYISTYRLVFQTNPESTNSWADLNRLLPYLRQSLSCTVCGNLLVEPHTPTETNCQHHVCRTCKGGKKNLKPSCSWCKNYDKYVENTQLRILLQGYQKLCEYLISCNVYRLMSKSSGDTNFSNVVDLIHEGAGFKDEYISNSGLSKSSFSILPCVYTSTSTQTVQHIINSTSDSVVLNEEEENFLMKSNLANGSSLYSVMYAGNGNKMVIKRKCTRTSLEPEETDYALITKQAGFKKPVHKKPGMKGRVKIGKMVSIEEKLSASKKNKQGCRCGNATPSPGKLTCCGQRCPCYVVSKACLDCRCRGCRNPHTKEGQKILREIIDPTTSKKLHSGVISDDVLNMSAIQESDLQQHHIVEHQLLRLRSDTDLII